MAEFPELGKNCSFEACRKLSFTPFFCSKCEKSFCNKHRFYHGCQFKNMDSKSETSNCGGSSKPLKPYLCSMNGCFTYEILRIDCQQCGFNFCLQHRYPEEHQCHIENVVNTHIKSVHQKEVMKNMAMVTVSGKSYRVADPLSQLQKKETVDEATRRRADRIAVMRLKGNIQNSYVPISEQMFLFLIHNGRREAVMVSKHWSIGRCVDEIAKKYSIPNSNSIFRAKMLRLYSETAQLLPLPMSDNIEKHVANMSNVFLKRDE